MAPQRNIRLLLEYDGTRYHGWQRQKNAVSIQQVLEEALTRLTGEEVRLIGSGRTDAGVHALGQVANFHSGGALPLKAFEAGVNSMLPWDIVVLEAREVPPEFHARKSALSKTYEYRILNRPAVPPCITILAGGFQGSWIWRPWRRPRRCSPGSTIFPPSGPAAAGR